MPHPHHPLTVWVQGDDAVISFSQFKHGWMVTVDVHSGDRDSHSGDISLST